MNQWSRTRERISELKKQLDNIVNQKLKKVVESLIADLEALEKHLLDTSLAFTELGIKLFDLYFKCIEAFGD